MINATLLFILTFSRPSSLSDPRVKNPTQKQERGSEISYFMPHEDLNPKNWKNLFEEMELEYLPQEQVKDEELEEQD